MMGRGSRMTMMKMTVEVATVAQAAMVAPVGMRMSQLKTRQR